ncbi:hypothetical protein IE53DRAFT_228237 [Violaceomyces palustris]|uniref:Uncharacterized protein n=1 Tax=Violaceomyces palustris TaxID=1673888 RepID=A0ACD0P4K7_9BASI|nr:hypothetical protein IE53DRAFT_228237 [Violaceomyces palustris]
MIMDRAWAKAQTFSLSRSFHHVVLPRQGLKGRWIFFLHSFVFRSQSGFCQAQLAKGMGHGFVASHSTSYYLRHTSESLSALTGMHFTTLPHPLITTIAREETQLGQGGEALHVKHEIDAQTQSKTQRERETGGQGRPLCLLMPSLLGGLAC